MSSKIRKSSLIQNLLIYVMICFQGSVGFRTYNAIFTVIAYVAAAIVFLYRKKIIPQHYVIFSDVLLLSLILEIFLTDGGVYLSSIVSIMSRFAIILAAYYYDEENFSTRYVKMVVFFASISLVGFALVCINSSMLIAVLPVRVETASTYWNTYNVNYYGMFLFSFTSATMRNIGIFHEPGLYQIVLNVAIYLLMFKENILWLKQKEKTRYLIILTVTMLTTMSTTGLIAMIGLLVIYLLFYKRERVNTKIKWGILALMSVAMIYEIFAGENSYINRNIVSKIISDSGKIDFSTSTGKSRILSLMSDWTIFKSYPFGIGYLNYNAAFKDNLMDPSISDTSSCVGFTQVLAILGIIVFAIVVIYYIYLMKRNLKGAEIIAFLLLFINTGLAQPYIWFPAITVLLLINDKRVLGDDKYV